MAHDVIINEEDCGTLRGLVCTEIKNNEEVVASLSERILGRVSVHDIVDPYNPEEIIVHAGEEITEAIADRIEKSPIESVEIRSPFHTGSRVLVESSTFRISSLIKSLIRDFLRI